MTETLQAPTVLIVDDEPDIRELVRLILEKDGIEVIDAMADGAVGLERYYALQPPPRPSVVVLDNRMPGLSGLEVAEQMLSHYPGQVIVLFSAFVDSSVTAKARAIGVTACVSKTELTRLAPIIRGLLPAG